MGLWTGSLKRSRGEEARTEDVEWGNIRDMKFIDCGCSVLWSDKYFRTVDTDVDTDSDSEECEYFKFDDINKMKLPKGYRLPTADEVNELIEKFNPKLKYFDHVVYNGLSFISNCTHYIERGREYSFNLIIRWDMNRHMDDKEHGIEIKCNMNDHDYCGTYWKEGVVRLVKEMNIGG